MTRAFVTGAAGFIGSTLVDSLLRDGHIVVGYDNLSTGRPSFLKRAAASPRFTFVQGDVLDHSTLADALRGAEIVFHLAANADVRLGPQHPDRDLRQNTLGTFHVLEAMRASDCSNIAFCSTGSVYGEAAVIPTPEDAPFPVQTSLYGASKLSAEALITAYAEAFGMRTWIFRLVSILGERYTHGHIIDFVRRLAIDAESLVVLGDGTQRKSYLYIHDCVSAMRLAVERSCENISILNIGTDEALSVKDSVRIITDELGVQPAVTYTGGKRGWVGDNPLIHLDCSRMKRLGWAPQLSIEEAVRRTVRYLRSSPEILAP